MKKIAHFLLHLPVSVFRNIRNIKPWHAMKTFTEVSVRLGSFVLLLLTYLFEISIMWVLHLRFVPDVVERKVGTLISRVSNKIYGISRYKESSFNRVNLIQIALKNMAFKPARTFITIGGMAVGIAAIVFLVSLGYGLQRLVVSRVARLDELKQADVTPQIGSQLDITDETIASLQDIPEVKHVLPLITVVGRVNYQNSISDVAVFGVTSEYLKQSAVKPVEGDIFDSNEISKVLPKEVDTGQVAGVQTKAVAYGEIIGDVNVSLYEGEWIKVRSGLGRSFDELGYTRRVEGVQKGELIWGETYVTDTEFGRVAQDVNEVWLGQWIKAPLYMWDQVECDTSDPDCEDGRYKKRRLEDGTHEQVEGYMGIVSMSVTPYKILQKSPSVLGISSVLADETEATTEANINEELNALTAEDEATSSAFVVVETEDGFVEITSESVDEANEEVTKVPLGNQAVREAIVSRAMLQILGISESEAIGKTFDSTFIVTGDLLETETEKIESESEKYTIVGVDADENTPFFYVPFIDLRSLGVTKYSQLKVVAEDEGLLEKVRTQIEANGFVTASVVDTVSQIDNLFQTVRLILGSIGLVALAVAGLGMFNTMSISLLERTREVGLMKAMGMRSNEVHELFLTESMTMGFFGGVFGILIGIGGGKIISLILSIFSVSSGVGFVDISYLPVPFIVFIIVLSIIVGIATGFYPARRATRISALNALRYE